MLNTDTRHAPPAGVIRHLRPSELGQFKAHLLRLDMESRRDRFNGPTNDAFLESYAERSFQRGTIVIGYVENGKVLGAAELHECAGEPTPTGEIAFSVERELQHRGLGSLLFERLIASARSFGYEKLNVTTHPQNEAMKRLARKFNASLRFEDGETQGVIEIEPPLPVPARPGVGSFAMA
ncbi:GNAT family N-acetyltransferase [Aquamicrobium sp. LC103]|uniref:GNAT family N-acetyltransferase n=1 Tax=Aquamicrobium sp. LC103 TaxID=1120658 RepID=UPI00063EA0B8|nr:GNAT family N-acetyltransferase [Aquamicrobium sp. LC103]TKT79135.1 GNAT family N-acetyltransferase [Aquamicrobium sp. LC103]